MVEMTVQLSDEVAERVQPLSNYLSTVLELALMGIRTPAAETVSEIIEFLSTDPSSAEVLAYHVSDRTQSRLERLLALSGAGLLGQEEQVELDEMEKIEHVIVLLKARIAQGSLALSEE